MKCDQIIMQMLLALIFHYPNYIHTFLSVSYMSFFFFFLWPLWSMNKGASIWKDKKLLPSNTETFIHRDISLQKRARGLYSKQLPSCNIKDIYIRKSFAIKTLLDANNLNASKLNIGKKGFSGLHKQFTSVCKPF